MKTRQSKINVCRVLLMSLSMGLTSLCSADDAQPAWDKTPASKEINGMRRYSRGLVEAISAGMRQSEKQKYPGVRAFLEVKKVSGTVY